MSNIGHNEAAVRLAALAGDAQIALDKVAKGEADAIDGWLAYGAALNEGRALHAGDKEFSVWMAEWQLAIQVEAHERSAAMWAAANADQLAEAKAACKARTLRGWHDQWKKIEQEREAARLKSEREADQDRKRQEAEAARAEADEKAKAEKAAQKAVAAASTHEDREIAEAKAEAAAEEKAEADRAAEVAEAAAQSREDPEIDPAEAKLRRDLSKLTTDALIDDAVGLRADLADAKAKGRAQKAEIDALKSQLRDLSDSDSATVIRRLQRDVKDAENAKWRATEEQQKAMKQVYALKKRVEELERMEIAL